MPTNLLTLDAAAALLDLPKVEVIRATIRRELDKVNVAIPHGRHPLGRTMIDCEALGRFARRRGLRVKEVTGG